MKEKHKEISKGGTGAAKVLAKVSSSGLGDRGNSPGLGLSDIQRYKMLPTSNSSSSQKSRSPSSNKVQLSSLVKECRVVLEKVSVPVGAGKPHEQEHCPSEPNKTSQLNSKDKPFLDKLQLKQPILWPKSNNKEDWEDYSDYFSF